MAYLARYRFVILHVVLLIPLNQGYMQSGVPVTEGLGIPGDCPPPPLSINTVWKMFLFQCGFARFQKVQNNIS